MPSRCRFLCFSPPPRTLNNPTGNRSQAYRKHGIRIVAIHNHMFGTKPELMFCHFAAEGDAMELARAIRAVWAPLKLN